MTETTQPDTTHDECAASLAAERDAHQTTRTALTAALDGQARWKAAESKARIERDTEAAEKRRNAEANALLQRKVAALTVELREARGWNVAAAGLGLVGLIGLFGKGGR